MTLAYDGSGFVGFQSQPGGGAVQDCFERALKTFFRRDIRIRGASRTDSGVHAQGQVLLFSVDQDGDMRRWCQALNALTPPSVGVLSIIPVDQRFDPIFDARAKAYRYRIWLGRCPHPWIAPQVWNVYEGLNPDAIERVLRCLVGYRDFEAFCDADSDAQSTDRLLFATKVEREGPLLDIWFLGNGFLKQMIRILVGTAVDVARGRIDEADIPDILLGRQRGRAGQTAPAHGLTLVELFYDDVPRLERVIARQRRGYAVAVY